MLLREHAQPVFERLQAPARSAQAGDWAAAAQECEKAAGRCGVSAPEESGRLRRKGGRAGADVIPEALHEVPVLDEAVLERVLHLHVVLRPAEGFQLGTHFSTGDALRTRHPRSAAGWSVQPAVAAHMQRWRGRRPAPAEKRSNPTAAGAPSTEHFGPSDALRAPRRGRAGPGRHRAARAECTGRGVRNPPSPPPPSVLTGHVSSLLPY
jgi:hypothetical protein